MTTLFAGMPDEGLAFLEDLEERNTRDFFDANKAVFKEQVQAPFAALVEAAAARLRGTVPDLGQPTMNTYGFIAPSPSVAVSPRLRPLW